MTTPIDEKMNEFESLVQSGILTDDNSTKQNFPLQDVLEPEEEQSLDAVLQEENSRLKDQLLRTMAEMDNLRKRSQREKEEARQYALTNFARDLLNVADNLDRALGTFTGDAIETSPAVKSVVEGIQLIQKELESVLTRYDVKKVPSLGEKFDHNVHQAMFETESSDHEAGLVTQVLQEGYTLHDRLLRPAMVGVSK